jgi:putative membrane protein
MTVRVGIAAMRVVRPLPFETRKAPLVRDFLPDLVSTTRSGPGSP